MLLIPLLWLAGALIPLVFLNRWLGRHIRGLGLLVTDNPHSALYFYYILLLPGIIIHELSHWLMAKALGLRPGKISLGPVRKGANQVRLGSVSMIQSDPLRDSLAGLAPLLAGSAMLLLIGTLAFDLRALSQAFVLRDAGRFFTLLAQSVRVPDFWIWLYAIFAISNAMLPSESDRRAWLPLGVFLLAIALILMLIGWTPKLPARLVDAIIGGVEYLTTAFLLTLAVDLVCMALFGGLEMIVSRLTGRRLKY